MPLLEHMVSEFDGQGTISVVKGKIVAPKFFGAFALYAVQKEFIGKGEIPENFESGLLDDPVLRPVPGPEQIDQRNRWEPLDRWLGPDLEGLRHYAFCKGLDGLSYEEKQPTDSDTKITAKLKSCYLALSPEQRTVVMFLCVRHGGAVLFPLALVLGKCTESEYAQGVMASYAILTGVFGDVKNKDHRRLFDELRANARAALDYIQYYRKGTPNQKLIEYISAGENDIQEFKSTLRWNLHSNRADDAITHACVKTIAAFFNTQGGRLLIGVADDGTIVGIERDQFPNQDKFQLHLCNVLKQQLGETAAITGAAIELLSTPDNKTVCVVTCTASKVPVFCRLKGGEEHFYVRTGPSTTQLPPSELVTYVADHFPTKARSPKCLD